MLVYKVSRGAAGLLVRFGSPWVKVRRFAAAAPALGACLVAIVALGRRLSLENASRLLFDVPILILVAILAFAGVLAGVLLSDAVRSSRFVFSRDSIERRLYLFGIPLDRTTFFTDEIYDFGTGGHPHVRTRVLRFRAAGAERVKIAEVDTDVDGDIFIAFLAREGYVYSSSRERGSAGSVPLRSGLE